MSKYKIKCDCGAKPRWVYMPGFSNNSNSFFCDNCVPRGCSCNIRPKDGNWENYNEDNWESELDEQGKEYPCCEYEWIYDDDYEDLYEYEK